MKTTKGDYYSKIPNQLFYSAIKGQKSIYQLVKDAKVLLIWDYLYTSTDRKSKFKFTLEDMIINCGYKPDSHKRKTNDQFKDILVTLQNEKYIICDYDLRKIKSTDFVSCSFCIDLSKNYIELFDKEKDVILPLDNKKIDNTKLLMFYCYLKARRYNRKKGDDLSRSGGRAEVAYPTYELITKDIDLTDETIKKYIDLLVSLDLIRIDNPGLWYYADDKNMLSKESPNFYALFDGDEEAAKHQLKEGIKYYKKLDINSKKIFIETRNYKNNNRSLNGKLGAITKKENNGTATPEDLQIKNQILESKNADSEEYKFRALLEANPDKILSEIYADLYKTEFAEKISDLEYNFGLIDDAANLLVEKDYYTWIMTNYKKHDEQYMINCVFKHKKDNNLIDIDPDVPLISIPLCCRECRWFS